MTRSKWVVGEWRTYIVLSYVHEAVRWEAGDFLARGLLPHLTH